MEEKLIFLKTSYIKPYENNAKIHDDAQIEMIIKSIKEFGFTNPLLIDENNNLIAGHGRLLAAERMGMSEVPCRVIKGLTYEQRRALILADNKIAEMADWDYDKLEMELNSIADIDMADFGFDLEIDEHIEVQEDNYEIDEHIPTEPKAKYGQIYQLGRHRLMCGDSTKEEDVSRLMNGQKADMVFTDPPYGMKKEKYGVTNDNLNFDDLLEFNKKWIPLTFNNLKENGSWYCWGIDEPLMDIYSNILKPMAKENKITFRNLITWDKGNGQGQLSSYFRMYPIADEKCLFVIMD